jgi:hypothetical protein
MTAAAQRGTAAPARWIFMITVSPRRIAPTDYRDHEEHPRSALPSHDHVSLSAEFRRELTVITRS